MIFNRYLISMVLVGLLMTVVVTSIIFSTFMTYVPPGKMLVIIAKNGDDMAPGQILAKPGQKGVLQDVLGEGLHFVLPVSFHTELHPTVIIPPGKIGLVISRVGKAPIQGTILVNDDEQGTRRRILTPGAYRLNPYGYKIEERDAVFIRPGFVGFVTSLVGRPPKEVRSEHPNASGSITFFAAEGERGVRKDVLPPGFYYLNPLEFRVQEVEVGINQVSFLERNNIRFPSKDAFDISVEA
ncbi:MAG: hypothetical protein WA705_27615, partial [Candidatus Ozemobacteraceae bacterium]